MRRTLIRLALAGAAVTVLAAGAASAQIPAPPPPPAPPAPPLPPLPPLEAMGPHAMIMHHGRSADPEKRAQRLRDILQLRGDQDGALKAYVEATTPKIEVRKVAKDSKDGAEAPTPPTTLERLDRMTKAGEAMQKRAAATRSFYLALTPSQQKTFDVLGMAEDFGGERIRVQRFDTRGPAAFKSGRNKVVIERKVG